MSGFISSGCGSCSCGVRVARLDCPLTPFSRSLFFSRRKRAVELAVDEEVGEDAARAPGDTIGPSFDARGSLFVHEDIAAHDELIAFPVVRTTKTVSKSAAETSLENDQRVLGRFDVAPPCRHTRRGLPHTHIAEVARVSRSR